VTIMNVVTSPYKGETSLLTLKVILIGNKTGKIVANVRSKIVENVLFMPREDRKHQIIIVPIISMVALKQWNLMLGVV